MVDFANLGYFPLLFQLPVILRQVVYLISSKVNNISRVLIPIEYKANIWSSRILALIWSFLTITGSKVELLSLSVLKHIFPASA